ncbi:MAG: hypothetical protein ACK56I_36220, partial [bacterium]
RRHTQADEPEAEERAPRAADQPGQHELYHLRNRRERDGHAVDAGRLEPGLYTAGLGLRLRRVHAPGRAARRRAADGLHVRRRARGEDAQRVGRLADRAHEDGVG